MNLVYKLTNTVNGKIYIGCHMTKNVNDNYMGSGERLNYAKKKYGIDNFKKEILSVWETPEEMFTEEARLVNEEFVGRDDVYNLTCGGRGSWFYVNVSGIKWKSKGWLEFISSGRARDNAARCCREIWNKRNPSERSKFQKRRVATTPRETILKVVSIANRASITPEANAKRSKTMKRLRGPAVSTFGKRWVNNGVNALMIDATEVDRYVNDGYRLGRKLDVQLEKIVLE